MLWNDRWYTAREVGTHCSTTDCWVTISGRVYNVTPLFADNPPVLCEVSSLNSFRTLHLDSAEAPADVNQNVAALLHLWGAMSRVDLHTSPHHFRERTSTWITIRGGWIRILWLASSASAPSSSASKISFSTTSTSWRYTRHWNDNITKAAALACLANPSKRRN